MYGESVSPLAMLLPVVVYPLLAAVVLGLVLFQFEHKQLQKPAFWLATGLIWLAWITAAQGIHTRWQLPPRQALDWLLIASLVPVLATRLPKEYRMSGFGVASMLSFALVAQPLLGRMSTIEIFTQVVGWLLFCGMAISASDRQQSAFRFPVSQIVMIVTSAVVIGISSSLNTAQMTGSLAVVLGVIWLLNRIVALSAQSILAVTQATMALWLFILAYAFYYADVSIYALMLLALPLLIKWTDNPGDTWWKKIATTVAISLLPGVLAIWWVWPEQSLY
ncbi:hypothetical protein [Oceanospirillum beijerinckii]|uniref:hypothetical protein n=1 Tax=Oceanospirillum beijerinckii TaxID=64976 RepID=UPI0004075FB6|nr:hypothetical protein [Oceanospirillum beijerinckii]